MCRGRRVSQKERNDNSITNECYAYGELNYDIFATIYEKVTSAYGSRSNGTFFDLGCGVGQLVYAAAILGNFSCCGGIEHIGALLDRGVKRMVRWNKFKETFPVKQRQMQFVWLNEDILETKAWLEATFIILHWTAFPSHMQNKIADMLCACDEGTICITFTTPVPGDNFEILVQDSCRVSWGEADFFVQEKLTPRQVIGNR